MTDSTAVVVNYSPAAEAVLLAAIPFNFAKAKELAIELDKKPKSIVAKVKRMESDESIKGDRPFYIAKEAYVPKTGAAVEKKSEVVSMIETLLQATGLTNLVKADKTTLNVLRAAIIASAPESEVSDEG